METPWLTAAQAAEYLQVHVTTIYNWFTAGVITATRIGKGRGRLRFNKDDLDRLLRENKTTGQPPEPRRRKRKYTRPEDLMCPESLADVVKKLDAEKKRKALH